MNELQQAIFQVITSIFNNYALSKKFEVHEEFQGQKIIENSAIRYGILNYVAKYSLANNQYYITDRCLEHISNLKLINRKGLLRSKKGAKYKFTFEHPVPSNIVADLLYANHKSESRLRNILEETDIVTIISYDEDQILNRSKLTSRMPPDWKIFKNNNFDRYTAAGLQIPTKKMTVYGALAR